MKTFLKRVMVMLAATCVLTTTFACDGFSNSNGNESGDNNSNVIIADTTAPRIKASYEYKIVLVGQETTLPTVTVDEEALETHTLDGAPIEEGGKFTPEEVGNKVYKITATDNAGNKSIKEVLYTITDDAQDLNKIYALDTVEGLNKQVGTTRNGLNNLAVKLITAQSDRPNDLNNNPVPDLYLDENNNVVSSESLASKTIADYLRADIMQDRGMECRMVFDNPLYKNWNEHFSQLYFYVYNAGLETVTGYFNNYQFSITPNSGWQKVIIAPMNIDGEIVTDFTKISSLGGGYDTAGMFDLEDCTGATLRLVAPVRYERIMMTAIYGVPVNK